MAWTAAQKRMAMACCRKAGVSDEHRRLLLAQVLPPARAGEVRAASFALDCLSNAHFDAFMALLEGVKGGRLEGFAKGHWAGRGAGGADLRRRHRLLRMHHQMICLMPQWNGMPGWDDERLASFLARQTGGRVERVEQLAGAELVSVLEGLSAFARRHGVVLEEPRTDHG